MEVAAGTSFVPDAELDRRINQALRGLYDKLIAAHGQSYYLTESTQPTVAGTSLYNLPADFYKLSSVEVDDGSNFVPLSPFSPQERWRLKQLGVSSNSSMYVTKYRLTPSQIALLPAPNLVYTLTVNYIPTMPALVAPGDTFDAVNGWHEWACLSAAIGMLSKEESDTRALMAERDLVDRRIEQLAGSRDAGNPEVVQDTLNDRVGDLWFWSRSDWNY